MRDNIVWIVSNKPEFDDEYQWYGGTWQEALEVGNEIHEYISIMESGYVPDNLPKIPFYVQRTRLTNPEGNAESVFEGGLLWENFCESFDEIDPEWWPELEHKQLWNLEKVVGWAVMSWLHRHNIWPRSWEHDLFIGKPIKVLPNSKLLEPKLEKKEKRNANNR